MVRYQVVLTKTATDDITNIGKYIKYELHNPEAAERLVDKFYDTISGLREMPEKFRVLEDELYIIPEGIRRVSVDNYGVYYQCDEDNLVVEVVRVLYGKREWQNFL